MLDSKLLQALGGWEGYVVERVQWPQGDSRTVSIYLKPQASVMHGSAAVSIAVVARTWRNSAGSVATSASQTVWRRRAASCFAAASRR
jgi:hypothetical protein